jgi:hypothetical protein
VTTDSAPQGAPNAAKSRAWPRLLLGIGGLVLLAGIVRHVGVDVVVSTLGPALPWLPVIAFIELVRIGCMTVGSYLAFGALASRIPRWTLFRAHVLGHTLSSVVPAPTVWNETIKATLITPFTGSGPAAAVGVTNQAAVWMSNGLLSIFCGLAILALEGWGSVWFYACVVHTVVLLASGVALQMVMRADAPGRWLARRVPSLATRAGEFRQHARGIRLGARGPTEMLFIGRCLQMLQYFVAARAIGIDVGLLRVAAAEGVHLVAMAVGVLVPGGLGTTEGAFTLANDLLGTTAARATALALLMRCMQIVWVLLGSIVALFTRGDARPEASDPL